MGGGGGSHSQQEARRQGIVFGRAKKPDMKPWVHERAPAFHNCPISTQIVNIRLQDWTFVCRCSNPRFLQLQHHIFCSFCMTGASTKLTLAGIGISECQCIIRLLGNHNNRLQIYKRFKRTQFITTNHSMWIFGVIPFIKLQNDT